VDGGPGTIFTGAVAQILEGVGTMGRSGTGSPTLARQLRFRRAWQWAAFRLPAAGKSPHPPFVAGTGLTRALCVEKPIEGKH